MIDSIKKTKIFLGHFGLLQNQKMQRRLGKSPKKRRDARYGCALEISYFGYFVLYVLHCFVM